MIILMSALLLLAIVPLSASADSSYNATVPGGKAVKLAEEPIYLGSTVKGTQTKLYSTGSIGAQYYITNSVGETVDSKICYCSGNIELDFSTKALGETLSLWVKNLYTGTYDAFKLVGTWFD